MRRGETRCWSGTTRRWTGSGTSMTWPLGELEADVSALADGEHEVLLAALLRDAEEESAALGARFTLRASEGDKRPREVGE